MQLNSTKYKTMHLDRSNKNFCDMLLVQQLEITKKDLGVVADV